jgi:hypothetical protein
MINDYAPSVEGRQMESPGALAAQAARGQRSSPVVVVKRARKMLWRMAHEKIDKPSCSNELAVVSELS